MSTRTRIPRNGYTIAELAKKTGKSARTVERWTSEPRQEYLKRSSERHQQIRELRAQGLSMRTIAEKVGVTVGAVHYAIHKTEQGTGPHSEQQV